MDYTLRYKRKLPHFQPEEGVFFVTFRLAFGLPVKYLGAINRYRDVLNARYENQDTQPETKTVIKKKLFAYEDELYPLCGSGVSLTDKPAVAELLCEHIQSNHNILYYLYCYTVMPNHVHILLKPGKVDNEQVSLSDIVRSLKGGSARKINSLLNRSGTLWHREYWDYWLRNQQELVNIMEYIRNNPVQAELVSEVDKWKWTWINPDLWDS